MIRIVTDSSAGIPPDLCEALSITVVPVPVHFGSTVFTGGVEEAGRFYELLSSEPPPTTSTPSPAEFEELYRSLSRGGEPVLSIHIMETKSGLINAARMAAAALPAGAVTVVDSGSTSMGMGLQVLAAARAARQGATLTELRQMVARLRERAALFAAIPQLTQLRRSGRVSLSQSLVAGLLAIKPVLYVGQSRIDVVRTVRGWRQAVEQMVALAEAGAGGREVHLAVVHTNAEAAAHSLLQEIGGRFRCAEALVAEAGPALAAHAGEGALGIATLTLE